MWHQDKNASAKHKRAEFEDGDDDQQHARASKNMASKRIAVAIRLSEAWEKGAQELSKHRPAMVKQH